jgi:hypothetical protein
VLEVEGEHRQIVPLGVRHDRGVRQAEIEVGEASIDLDGVSQKTCRQERDLVLAGGQAGEEQPGGVRAHPRAKQLVGFDGDGHRDDQIAAEARDELRCEAMCLVAPVRRGNERSRVGDDSQGALTGSRR